MTTNREISEAFKQAKAILCKKGDGTSEIKEKFICNTLNNLCFYKHSICLLTYEKSIGIIRERLDGEYILENWLDKNVKNFSFIDLKKIQATRHAWLDSLIKEFNVDGDYTGD